MCWEDIRYNNWRIWRLMKFFRGLVIVTSRIASNCLLSMMFFIGFYWFFIPRGLLFYISFTRKRNWVQKVSQLKKLGILRWILNQKNSVLKSKEMLSRHLRIGNKTWHEFSLWDDVQLTFKAHVKRAWAGIQYPVSNKRTWFMSCHENSVSQQNNLPSLVDHVGAA